MVDLAFWDETRLVFVGSMVEEGFKPTSQNFG